MFKNCICYRFKYIKCTKYVLSRLFFFNETIFVQTWFMNVKKLKLKRVHAI